MNETRTKTNSRDRMMYLNIIAEKDQEIARLKAERDGDIEYYRRAAEFAVTSKRRALNSADERRKDLIAFAISAVVIAAMIYGFAYGIAMLPG